MNSTTVALADRVVSDAMVANAQALRAVEETVRQVQAFIGDADRMCGASAQFRVHLIREELERIARAADLLSRRTAAHPSGPGMRAGDRLVSEDIRDLARRTAHVSRSISALARHVRETREAPQVVADVLPLHPEPAGVADQDGLLAV